MPPWFGVRCKRLTLACVIAAALGTLTSYIQLVDTRLARPQPASSQVASLSRPQSQVESLVERARWLYPNALTRHPPVDCGGGHYLSVASWYEDGLGSSLTSYSALVGLAIEYNLTIIDFPFRASHLDTNNRTLIEQIHSDRARKLGLSQWHVSRGDYDRCANDSAVKQNVLYIADIVFDKLTFREPTKESPSALIGAPAASIGAFVRIHSKMGNGLTIKLGHWWGYRGDMRRVSTVFAVRRHLTSRPIVISDQLSVGVHVRQGDRGLYNATTDQFMLYALYREWVMSTRVWRDMLSLFLSSLPIEMKPRVHFTIYSELYNNNTSMLDRYVRPLLSYPHTFSFSLSAVDSMLQMARSHHVFIGSPSDFSRSLCLTNVDVLKLANDRSMRFRHYYCHNVWEFPIDYGDFNETSQRELIDETRLNQFQSLGFVSQERRSELTERIRESYHRPIGMIDAKYHLEDWQVYHASKYDEKVKQWGFDPFPPPAPPAAADTL